MASQIPISGFRAMTMYDPHSKVTAHAKPHEQRRLLLSDTATTPFQAVHSTHADR